MRSYLHFRQRARDPGRAVWLGGQRGQVDGRGGHDGARAVRVRGEAVAAGASEAAAAAAGAAAGAVTTSGVAGGRR